MKAASRHSAALMVNMPASRVMRCTARSWVLDSSVNRRCGMVVFRSGLFGAINLAGDSTRSATLCDIFADDSSARARLLQIHPR